VRSFCFLCKKGSPAEALLKRQLLDNIKPGHIFMVTEEELQSWREDVEIVWLSEPEG